MAERLTDEDLDGIARFGVAIESDQQSLAAELLAYRQAARATDKESLTVVAAPDLDALARLLEDATRRPWSVEEAAHGEGTWYGRVRGVYNGHSCVVANVDDMADTHLIAAAVNALPALLATARRERRYRGVLAELRDGEWGPASYKARAALAEEGQDG